MAELKACPFCGGHAEMDSQQGYRAMDGPDRSCGRDLLPVVFGEHDALPRRYAGHRDRRDVRRSCGPMEPAQSR